MIVHICTSILILKHGKIVFSELHFQCLWCMLCVTVSLNFICSLLLSLSFSLFHASLSLARARALSLVSFSSSTPCPPSLALFLRPFRLFAAAAVFAFSFCLHFPQVPLPASRVTLGAQVLPFLFFRVVPNRTGRLRFTTATLLPTQRDQLLIVTIHAQMCAFHGLTLQPTPARLIAPARDATLLRNCRSLAIITSMAQTHPDFHVRVVPTRGRLSSHCTPHTSYLQLRQFFVIALSAQVPACITNRTSTWSAVVAHRQTASPTLTSRLGSTIGRYPRLVSLLWIKDR